jgi:hypothetical protein
LVCPNLLARDREGGVRGLDFACHGSHFLDLDVRDHHDA